MPETFEIVREPVGQTYRALLAFAARLSGSFSLVWRHQLSFDTSAAVLEGVLRPFLIKETESSEWPGTRLIGHSAIVRTYRLSPDSMRALGIAGGLYRWRSPTRPEDLAFYGLDGRCWLATIAHEGDAFVALDANDLAALRAALPELELRRSGETAG